MHHLTPAIIICNWNSCVVYVISIEIITEPQVAVVTKFCIVARIICGSSVWNLLHFTLLVPRILRWPWGFFGRFMNPLWGSMTKITVRMNLTLHTICSNLHISCLYLIMNKHQNQVAVQSNSSIAVVSINSV